VNRIRALRRPSAPTRPKLRTVALLCSLTTLATLAFAPDAFANFFTPQTGSPNANKINDLYEITLVIAAIIFVGVEGTLLYALIRFRKRRGRVAAQIHGNTRIEIGWTVGATIILIALAVVTFTQLNSIRNPPNSPASGLNLASSQYAVDGPVRPPNGRAITIQVNAQQYIWRYTYLHFGTLADQLDDPYSYYKLYVPTNTDIVLKLVSQDVVHSWWVPDLGGKYQVVPGYTSHGWFIAPTAKTYRGQCAFICGRGHARMTTEVVALPPKQWLAWLHGQEQRIKQANGAQAKARAQQKNKTGAAAVEVGG
jgi:cytochrome c oxidase subunit II